MKYEKVIIKSEADLPKEGEKYLCIAKNGTIEYIPFVKRDSSRWLRNIDWYLQPLPEVSVSDDMINKKIFELCSEMRLWDGKSSPKTTPELLFEFAQWMRKQLTGQ